jgi:hypothetical protein
MLCIRLDHLTNQVLQTTLCIAVLILYLETRVSAKGSQLWVIVHHELHPQYIMFVHMD